LRYWGQQYGLNFCGFINQTYFMLSLGLTDHLRNDEQQMKLKNAAEHEKKILLQTLLLDMGSKFKVLIQSKGIKEPKLSGLQFSHGMF
jgi:SAM-dependent MidA family methyltransferase